MNDYQFVMILEQIVLNYIHCKLEKADINKKQFDNIYNQFLTICNKLASPFI